MNPTGLHLRADWKKKEQKSLRTKGKLYFQRENGESWPLDQIRTSGRMQIAFHRLIYQVRFLYRFRFLFSLFPRACAWSTCACVCVFSRGRTFTLTRWRPIVLRWFLEVFFYVVGRVFSPLLPTIGGSRARRGHRRPKLNVMAAVACLESRWCVFISRPTADSMTNGRSIHKKKQGKRAGIT